MRPTWKAETIVERSANVSGSTSVWWLVVADALHVPCVNGSELTGSTAASAAPASTNVPSTPTPAAQAPRRNDDRSSRPMSYFLSTREQPSTRSLTGDRDPTSRSVWLHEVTVRCPS